MQAYQLNFHFVLNTNIGASNQKFSFYTTKAFVYTLW